MSPRRTWVRARGTTRSEIGVAASSLGCRSSRLFHVKHLRGKSGGGGIVPRRVLRFLPRTSRSPSMPLSASSMNFYGIFCGFYEMEMGIYDIEVGFYEIDGRFYEMVLSEEQMSLLRHRRPIADAEPVRGRLLRGLHQTLMPLHLAPARETSMLRPQPTAVGWSLSVLNLVVCERCMMPRGSSSPRAKRDIGTIAVGENLRGRCPLLAEFYSLCDQKCLTTHVSPSATSSMVPS